MTDTTESLNAGVAASILMYEVYNGWISFYRKNNQYSWN
jgi:hypothetical protein